MMNASILSPLILIFVQFLLPTFLPMSGQSLEVFNGDRAFLTTTVGAREPLFVIHGLWPNWSNGSWPQYCIKNDPLNLTEISSIIPELLTYWPGFTPSSKNSTIAFWNHEWTKHGSCLYECMDTTRRRGAGTPAPQLDFFQLGLHLRSKYPYYNMLKRSGVKFTNYTQEWNTSKVYEHWLSRFNSKPMFTCSDEKLMDVRACFDCDINLISCSKDLWDDSVFDCFPSFLF
jgi:ribonuclease T2